MKLVTSEQMRELERRSEEAGVSTAQLMENAGLAVAQETWVNLGTLEDRRILVLAGPGNNGGDGLVAARYLFDWGAEVCVYLLRRRGEDDANYREVVLRQIPTAAVEEDPELRQLEAWLQGSHAVVDALLGTGRARPVEGALAEVLRRLRAARERPLPPRIIAVDLPTGVDADTGAVDPLTVEADATVALGLPKLGLYVLPGSRYAGRVQPVEIGIPAGLDQDLPLELLTRSWVRDHLPARPEDANKGTFGRVLVVGGSAAYVGAVYLAACAAARAGAGLVTAACVPAVRAALAARLPEATFLPLAEHEGAIEPGEARTVLDAAAGYSALLLGPGLTQHEYAQSFVRLALFGLPAEVPAVVDADGLNALARTEGWWTRLRSPTVVTPHPGEMARLLGVTVEQVQGDRLRTAMEAAARWRAVVVLKGANTVVAAPDGRAALSPFANPALATAGTGDVLAGTVAGLLAQGLPPFEAAACGVYLHAAAGERVRNELGDAGALAGDLLPELPRVMKDLRAG
ncbi:MAG TPA: NAD(P)H-hydrate dehydratase [Dehalococcoidia bacterium]